MSQKNNKLVNFFSTKLFVVLLAVGLLGLSLFVWNTQRTRIVAQLVVGTETKARSYASETEIRYGRIRSGLSRLASRGIPPESGPGLEEWTKDAAFYASSFYGLKSVAWVDEAFRIRQIVPLEGNESLLDQIALTVIADPLEANLWVPSYDAVEFQGFILGVVSIDDLLSPVIKEIDTDYMLQLSDGTRGVFTSDNWANPAPEFTASHSMTFQNATVLNLSLAPSTALLDEGTKDARNTLIYALLLSLFTLIAAIFAQSYLGRARSSELRYRNLFKSSQDAIFVTNLRGEFLEANLAASSMVGFSLAELKQMTASDLLAQNGHTRSQGLPQSWLEGGSTETTIRHKNSHEITVELGASLIDEGPDRLKLVLVMARDITERKAAEESLRLLNHAIEQSPVSVVITDANAIIQYVNPKFSQVTGYSADEAIGRNPNILQSGEQPSEYYQVMWENLVAGQEWQGEFHNKKKNGDLFWEYASIAGVRGQTGEITHYVAVKEEITQRKQLEEEHRRQERLAAVGQLAAGIAHDFNNILAAIALYSQIVGRSPEVGERNQERMEVINQQVTHASKLIEQILDFSRQSVLERRPLNLVPLLKEQVNLLKRTLPENIDIQLIVGPGDQIVNADPTRMRQMLTNLAVNARDAMPEGGCLRFNLEKLPIEVCRTVLAPKVDVDHCVRLIVSDTGTGIPASVLAHIFDPFYSTKAKGKGTGLGLAQVYGIVGQHHGHIHVESQLTVGTVFTVYLPAVETQSTESAQLDSSSIAYGQGETVLVVEDEATLRDALVATLEQWNYSVLAAENGEAALAVLAATESHVALILSDVIMPQMGGVALFHAVQEQGLATPMILITGHPMDGMLDELVAQGLIAYLAKPLQLDLLAQTIGQALTHKPQAATD